MSTIRVKKDKDYTVINNTGLKDKRLSWGAKGLLAYLISLPNDWKIIVEHLKTVSKDGRDSVNSKIKELMDAGYMSREDKQPVINGRLATYNYTVTEKPLRKNRYGKTVTENPELLNTKELNTNKVNTKELNSSKEEYFPKEKLNPSKKNRAEKNREDLELTKISETEMRWVKHVRRYGGFKTILPKESKKPSKTIMDSIKYIDLLLSNKFYDYVNNAGLLNKEFLKSINASSKEEVKQRLNNITFNQIENIAKEHKNGRSIKQTNSLSGFFLNLYGEKNKSLFLYYLFNSRTDKLEEAKKSLPESVYKLLQKHKKKNWDELYYYTVGHDLYKYWESIRDELLKINEKSFMDGVFKREFKSFENMFEHFIKYLKTWKNYNVGNLVPGGKTWKLFATESNNKYGCTLRIDEKPTECYQENYDEDYGYEEIGSVYV